MSDIEAVRRFQEWQEERLTEGRPNSAEDYEEFLRVSDLEDRLKSVREILEGDDDTEDALFLISAIVLRGEIR